MRNPGRLDAVILAVVVGLTLPGMPQGHLQYVGGSLKPIAVVLMFLLGPRAVRVCDVRLIWRFVIALTLFGVYRTVHTTEGDTSLLNWWLNFGMLFLVVSGLRTKDQVRLFSLVFFGLLMMAVLSAGLFSIYDIGRDITPQGRKTASLIGNAGHYIFYGMNGLLASVLGFVLLLSSKKLWEKIYLLPCFITAVLATATCGSRGALLGLAATWCFLLVSCYHFFESMMYKKIFILLSILIVFCIIPWQNIVALAVSDDFTTGSVGERMQFYRVSCKVFLANPLFGIGCDGMRLVLDNAVHNEHLRSFAEFGVVGGGICIFLWVSAFRVAFLTRRYFRNSKDPASWLILSGWMATLFGYFAWGFVDNQGMANASRCILICIAIILVYHEIAVREVFTSTHNDPNTQVTQGRQPDVG